MRRVKKVRILVIVSALFGALLLTGCTAAHPDSPIVEPKAAASAAGAAAAAEQSAAQKVAADQAAAIQSAAAKAAADQAALDKATADQLAAAQAAADQLAAAQAAADQAAAQAAADQAAIDEAAAESSAAAASSAAAPTGSGATGWYTPSGNWVSPETAARAIAAGINPGETVPNYLRCGTICGEGPTSGEVQLARQCEQGLVAREQCVGIDSDAIIAAASGYSGW